MTQKRNRLSKKATDTSAPTTATLAAGELSANLELSAPRKAWIAALKTLDRVADSKSAMPMLACALIRVTPDEILLAATDLGTFAMVRPTDGWTIRGVGDIAVSAKSLAKSLATMPDGEITLVGTLQSGVYGVALRAPNGATTTIAALRASDFPALASVPRDLAAVPAEPIRAMLESTLPTTCKDPTRFHLAGILVESIGDEIRMVSTDGHRLTKVQRCIGPTAFKLAKGVIVEGDACKSLVQLLKRVDAVELGINAKGFLVAHAGDTTLVCKTIDAQYPAYEQVIPKDSQVLVTLDREALVGAITRAKVACSSTRGMAITLVDGAIKLEASNPDGLEVKETLPAELNVCHAGYVIGCNPAYMLDALAMKTDRVTLAFSGVVATPSKDDQRPSGLDPLIVRDTVDQVSYPVGSARRLTVVMPMRI